MACVVWIARTGVSVAVLFIDEVDAVSMQPFHFGPAGQRLFGVLHPSVGAARALVVMCPPLLHEQMRSYRFFSQLAGRLSDAGLACLRFDYHGTGDSDGADSDFSPKAAPGDIELAAEALRARAGRLPLILFGIRASAMFALRAAPAARAEAAWLWQPVVDGSGYVEMLDARYLFERGSRDRYPARHALAPANASDLMGFRLSATFRGEMSAYQLDVDHGNIPVAIVAGADDELPAFANVRVHRLPASASAWAGEIDLNGLIHLRDVEPAVHALTSTMPGLAQGATHG